MGGMGDIGGGCWVYFEVDKKVSKDRGQLISAVDIPGAKSKKPKQVAITYPDPKSGNDITVNCTLNPGQVVHIEWDN